MSKHVGFDEVSAALEEKIRQARFLVQVSDEDPTYAYVIDAAWERAKEGDEGVVLSVALPLDEARRRAQSLRDRAWRYLWMKEGADSYLAFRGAVVHRPSCAGYALVMVPEEHAGWLHARLRSGMQTVLGIYEQAAEALVELAEGRDMGVL